MEKSADWNAGTSNTANLNGAGDYQEVIPSNASGVGDSHQNRVPSGSNESDNPQPGPSSGSANRGFGCSTFNVRTFLGGGASVRSKEDSALVCQNSMAEARNNGNLMLLECKRLRNRNGNSESEDIGCNLETPLERCECEELCESLGVDLKRQVGSKHGQGNGMNGSPDLVDLPHNRIRRGNVCEAWQSTKSCLKERIAFLYNSDTLSDVSFIVGRSRVRIPGHKFVLAIGSPVFDAMFNGPLQEMDESVELPDVEPEALLALFRFLYSDEVSLTAESVLTVLYTAKKYAVPNLEEHCVAFLKDNLTPDNAFLLLSQARLFDEPQLAALCLDCIDKNTAAALHGECFLEVDLSTLCVVLARDTLRIREYTLFLAVLRWAKQECIRRGLDVTPQNQRHVLDRALHLIRFPLMPVEEFSIGVAQMGILTESELVRLYLNFNITPANIAHRPKMEFMDRPRCYMTGKQLSVYRFQQVDTRWGYNGLSDQIRFTTDRRIYIVGFGLYGGLYGTKEYKVDIQISNTLSQTMIGHHSDAFSSDGSKSTFKIMFKEPVEILPDVLYTASATLRGPDSFYGAKGQRKVVVECPDKTTVTFSFSYSSDNNNGTSVEDGQIPELIFHT